MSITVLFLFMLKARVAFLIFMQYKNLQLWFNWAQGQNWTVQFWGR